MANQPYADFATNPTNPYYIHPNENPSIILVTPLLDHKNYQTWSRSMKVALISKNKLKFVDGTLPLPHVSDPLHEPWIRCNNMVLSWIQRSISETIVKSIMWCDCAAVVWKCLERRFAHGDIFRIADILEEIARYQQGTLDISSYFTHLTTLWEELENFRPLKDCSCAIPCTCGAASDLKKYKEQDKVIKFLKGLNEQYASVRSQIMLLDPLPDIDRCFSLVLQQERQMLIPIITDNSVDQQASIMQVRQTSYNHGKHYTSFSSTHHGGRGRGRGNHHGGRGPNNRTCTHCGRHNHIVDTCFELHGYPPGYQHKNSKSVNVAATASNATLKEGHINLTSATINTIQEQYNQILQLLQHSALQASSTPSNPSPTQASANSIISLPTALNSSSSPTFDFNPNSDWCS
ncbi:hypothetical protein TSUD_290710 [Trifolium subterraneum]|uniref:Retrotransposon Copia-like N-terminal domain-containing protein n=1 Tax=Trifolium subterraneum TaxID=3900 RepID=A0A2Z6P4A7_TRISU|nr:hypothetical protein TSUD_290710 [Trifolium subterraneum]